MGVWALGRCGPACIAVLMGIMVLPVGRGGGAVPLNVAVPGSSRAPRTEWGVPVPKMVRINGYDIPEGAKGWDAIRAMAESAIHREDRSVLRDPRCLPCHRHVSSALVDCAIPPSHAVAIQGGRAAPCDVHARRSVEETWGSKIVDPRVPNSTWIPSEPVFVPMDKYRILWRRYLDTLDAAGRGVGRKNDGGADFECAAPPSPGECCCPMIPRPSVWNALSWCLRTALWLCVVCDKSVFSPGTHVLPRAPPS